MCEPRVSLEFLGHVAAPAKWARLVGVRQDRASIALGSVMRVGSAADQQGERLAHDRFGNRCFGDEGGWRTPVSLFKTWENRMKI